MDQPFDVFNRQATKQNNIPFEKQIFPPQTNLLSNLDLDKFKPMNPENSVLNDKENSGQKKAHFGSLFSLTKVRKPANTILNKIYKKMLSPDIIFSVHGEKFPAHKDILAASCQFFDNMFTSGMKEAQAKEIEINDMSSQAFKVMLGFIYYEEPELTEDLATELLKVSDKYKLPELSDSCEDFLICNLTENNFVKIVQVAESIDNIKLKDAVLDFMARNLETVRKREDLFDVSKSVLIDLLSKVKSK